MSDERPNRLRAAAEEAMAAGLARSVSIVEQSGMVVVSKVEWESVQGEVAVLRARSVADAPDPAPSPSTLDPSDEREVTVERLIRRYEDRIHEAVTGDPGQVRWAIYTSVVADLRALAAARPTSPPEATKPDGSTTTHATRTSFRWGAHPLSLNAARSNDGQVHIEVPGARFAMPQDDAADLGAWMVDPEAGVGAWDASGDVLRVRPPGRRGMVPLGAHTVTWSDGKPTVHPSIVYSTPDRDDYWHGWLRDGEWSEA